MSIVRLIDGSSSLYRCYYGYNSDLVNNALGGLLEMITNISIQHPEDKLVLVIDHSGKNFRHRMFPEYKGTRLPTPPELRTQLALSAEFYGLLGLTVLQIPDVEGDDVLGTLAKQAAAQKQRCMILTNDKDMMQLICDEVVIFNPYKGRMSLESYGVEDPIRIIDLLALAGDTADNIPGVRGIGQTYALRLIRKYGTVEGIYDSLDVIKDEDYNMYCRLKDHREIALLSKELATIKTDVDVTINFDELKNNKPSSTIDKFMRKHKLLDLVALVRKYETIFT